MESLRGVDRMNWGDVMMLLNVSMRETVCMVLPGSGVKEHHGASATVAQLLPIPLEEGICKAGLLFYGEHTQNIAIRAHKYVMVAVAT